VLRDHGDEVLGAKYFKKVQIVKDVPEIQGLLCFSVIRSYPVPSIDTEAGVPPAHELADLPVVYLSFMPEQNFFHLLDLFSIFS
jgi:hypothetical protein